MRKRNRVLLAFMITPLIGPFVFGLIWYSWLYMQTDSDKFWLFDGGVSALLIAIVLGSFVSYPVALVIGLPVFLVANRFGITSPVLFGGIVGVVCTVLVFLIWSYHEQYHELGLPGLVLFFVSSFCTGCVFAVIAFAKTPAANIGQIG